MEKILEAAFTKCVAYINTDVSLYKKKVEGYESYSKALGEIQGTIDKYISMICSLFLFGAIDTRTFMDEVNKAKDIDPIELLKEE